MEDYEPIYTGHYTSARKALVKLKLASEKELAYLSDHEVAERINKSDYIVVKCGDDYGVLTKELYDKIVWISR